MVQDHGIILKSGREIELMRQAGRVVHKVLSRMVELAKPGVTTGELNGIAEDMISESGGDALFKGVVNPSAKMAFPAALCTSVNEELVHGVPGDRKLQDGDILSVDCGVRLAGYCGDSAVTIPVGKISAEVQSLLDVTRRSVEIAVEQIRPNRMWSEVAREIQSYVEDNGFSIVRDYVGHGIGRDMHEDPKVPNYWSESQRRMDFKLVPNLVIAVEPMVNVGGREVEVVDPMGWVVVTRDRRPSAHFEHTMAVTRNGTDVLTDGS